MRLFILGSLSPKPEHNTKSGLKEIQRLIRGLYRLSGHGQVETDAWKRVTANVELHANRTTGKNLHAAAIVDRELATNVCDAADTRCRQGGAGLTFSRRKNPA